MKRFSLPEAAIKVFLVGGGLILALIFAEFIAGKIPLDKIKPHSTDLEGDRYVIQPGLSKTFHTPSGAKKYSINSNGIRGDAFSGSQNYHILTVGASATECIFLDDKETWPYLIQEIVNRQGYRIWVGNVGRSGTTVRDHIRDSEILINQFPFIDAIILLTGINDMSVALAVPRDVSPDQPVKKTVFYERTSLWKLYSQIRDNFMMNQKFSQDPGLVSYEKRAKDRKNAVWIDTMPPMAERLLHYRFMLLTWVDGLRQRGVRPILVTQPTKWMEGLTEKEKDTLWFGWAETGFGDQCKKYYSVRVLKEAMDLYNKTMLDLCAEFKVECVDLAKRLPRDSGLFFDDCHFNASGSFLAADILAKYLTQEAPVKLPAFQDAKKIKQSASR